MKKPSPITAIVVYVCAGTTVQEAIKAANNLTPDPAIQIDISFNGVIVPVRG